MGFFREILHPRRPDGKFKAKGGSERQVARRAPVKPGPMDAATLQHIKRARRGYDDTKATHKHNAALHATAGQIAARRRMNAGGPGFGYGQ